MTRTTLLTLTIVLALFATPVWAHGEHDAEAIEQRIERSVTLDAPGILELDMFLPANTTIDIMVDAGKKKVYVDLHSHGAIDTIQHFQDNRTSRVETTFTAPKDDTYSLYVINREDSSTRVKLVVDGTFAVTGTSGFDLEQDAPLSLAVVVAAIVGAVLWVRRGR